METGLQTVDIRALSKSREIIAYYDGGQFPVLTVASNGAIVAVLRGGAGHIGPRGRIEIVRSLDAGLTWSPPCVVADSDRDDRNPALGTAADGTIVLVYQRQGGYDTEGNYRPTFRGTDPDQPVEVMVTRSHDAGLTWSTPTPINDAMLRTSSPYGKIAVDAEGTLYLTLSVRDREHATSSSQDVRQPDRCFLIRSRDHGATWVEPSLIASDMNETGLLSLPDGSLLAVMRRGFTDGGLWSSHSDDGGQTWSEPIRVTEAGRHPGDLVLLSNGDVFLTYGNRNPPYRIEARVSQNGGHTWLPGTITLSGPLYGANVASPRRTDFGYPSSVVTRTGVHGRGTTMYYSTPDIPTSGDWKDEGPNGPFYCAAGYRAIGVSWDEAEVIDALRQLE